MVGGGAKHSANVGRNVAFAAFGGREGIVDPKACEVRELSVPGSSVRVFPGTAAIRNRADGLLDEMYVGRLPSEDTVAIAATDSTGGRSDLIVARVENPFITSEPWPDPSDPTVGPYIFTRVISNVNPSTTTVEELGLGYSAIPLARIDIPASTATITQAMITDLRSMSQVQQQRDSIIVAPTATEQLAASSFTDWPSAATLTVDVPEWATHCRTLAILGGVVIGGSGNNGGAGWTAIGNVRLELAGASSTVNTQATKFNFSTTSGWDRLTFMGGSPATPIAAGNRGKTATLKIQGEKTSGSATDLKVDTASMVSLEVEFYTAPESNV